MSVAILLIFSLTAVSYVINFEEKTVPYPYIVTFEEEEYKYIPITADDGTELLLKVPTPDTIAMLNIKYITMSSYPSTNIDICNLNKKVIESLGVELRYLTENNIKNHIRVEKYKEYENVTQYNVTGGDIFHKRSIIMFHENYFWLDKNGDKFDNCWTDLNNSITLNETGLKVIPKEYYDYIRDMLLYEVEEAFASLRKSFKNGRAVYPRVFFKPENEYTLMLNSIKMYDPEIMEKYDEELKTFKIHTDKIEGNQVTPVLLKLYTCPAFVLNGTHKEGWYIYSDVRTVSKPNALHYFTSREYSNDIIPDHKPDMKGDLPVNQEELASYLAWIAAIWQKDSIEDLTDDFGTPIRFELTDIGLKATSAGSDKIFGTDDDIVYISRYNSSIVTIKNIYDPIIYTEHEITFRIGL